MKRRLWICVVCVMLFALCLVGCNRQKTPGSAEVETKKPTASVATEPIENTQTVETEPAQDDETADVTAPAESQTPENETTAPTAGSGNDQQTNQETQAPSDGGITYEVYNAMSAEDQQAFYLSFSNPQDFFNWYNSAKEAYENNIGNIVVGEDGVIDLEDLMGGSEG